MTKQKKGRIIIFTVLHVLLLLYSVTGIFSKLAAGTAFLSKEFCFYYAGIILLLGIYALGWQQVIKRMPLTIAYANKAITVVWGMIWGSTVFHEKISAGKAAGAVLVIAGVVLFALADGGNNE